MCSAFFSFFTCCFACKYWERLFIIIWFYDFHIVLAQIIAAVGYGHLFPWSIPAVASGMTGDATIDAAGILVVIVTNVMGVLGTMLWWRNADHG